MALIIRFDEQVNSTIEGNQIYPNVTALADGGWVVTWASDNQDGDGYGVYQQRYNAAGKPIGGEQRVSSTSAGGQYLASVTGLADGGWLVAWISDNGGADGADIYQQRYSAAGLPVGKEQLVNSHTPDQQGGPSVTSLADGGWVVTWQSFGEDTSDLGVYQQRYDSAGNGQGASQVNTTTADDQFAPSVTALTGASGGWVVTWQSFDANNSTFEVYQQRFKADGTPDGGETRVNTHMGDNQGSSSVTALADGGWVVTWQSNFQDGSGNGIYQQRYEADGTPVGTETRVNSYTDDNQSSPSVTALEDGGWLVTWISFHPADGSSDIKQQRYDQNGVVVGTSGAVSTFNSSMEAGLGTTGNDLFVIEKNGLNLGDSVDADKGMDTIRLVEAGTLDLTAPDLLTGVEIIQGSGGSDLIIADSARIAGILGIVGGAGADELRLDPGSYDFTGTVIAGMEAITLTGTGSATFFDKSAALLVHSQSSASTVTLLGDVFTQAERQQLYNQGIRHLTDSSAAHVLEAVAATLTPNPVAEGISTELVVGALSTAIPDPNPADGQALSFQLVDSAGGRFKLVGDAITGYEIRVANGVLLDYEQATSHTVVVRVTDPGGIATDTAFTITLKDVAAEKLTGTSASEALKGGAGKDVFNGAGGNDRLWGGLGHDTLTGGSGKDVFVFDTKPSRSANRDTISDFRVKDDSLWLDNKIFAKLGKAGSETKPAALNKGFFALDKARDKNDYLVYNKTTGVLTYDADGVGSKSRAVEIAVLKKGLVLTHKDFFVI